MLEDKFAGSMLGLALADAMGARYEGGPLGRVRALDDTGSVLTWTDDTEMARGLAESLVACRGLDADHLARTWAESMQPRRGYGAGARKLLERIRSGAHWREANRSVFPEGSFGNGAAMRAAPLGLCFRDDLEELRKHCSRDELRSRIGAAEELLAREPLPPRRSSGWGRPSRRTSRWSPRSTRTSGIRAIFSPSSTS